MHTPVKVNHNVYDDKSVPVSKRRHTNVVDYSVCVFVDGFESKYCISS